MSTKKSHSQQTIDALMRSQHKARETAGRNKLTEDDVRFLQDALGDPDADLVRLTEVLEQVGYDAALDLKALVVPYLKHHDAEAKAAALRTLVCGLGQLEYLEIALEILQRPKVQTGPSKGTLDPMEEERLGAIRALTLFVEKTEGLAKDASMTEVIAQRDRVLRALVKSMVQTKDSVTAAGLYEDLAKQLMPSGAYEPMSNEAMIRFTVEDVDTSFLKPYWPDEQSTAVH